MRQYHERRILEKGDIYTKIGYNTILNATIPQTFFKTVQIQFILLVLASKVTVSQDYLP